MLLVALVNHVACCQLCSIACFLYWSRATRPMPVLQSQRGTRRSQSCIFRATLLASSAALYALSEDRPEPTRRDRRTIVGTLQWILHQLLSPHNSRFEAVGVRSVQCWVHIPNVVDSTSDVHPAGDGEDQYQKVERRCCYCLRRKRSKRWFCYHLFVADLTYRLGHATEELRLTRPDIQRLFTGGPYENCSQQTKGTEHD